MERFVARGVTYGSFLPRRDGAAFPEPHRVEQDMASIAAMGLNTVRIYTPPTCDLLDAAEGHGLRLIVGADYKDWRYRPEIGRRTHRAVTDAGKRALDDVMLTCAGRTGVLAVSVGNEVPADIARVHGIAAVEDVLSGLVRHAHDADPGVLVTYTNYPTTEFLTVDGIDIVSFNLFLDEATDFEKYLRHLQIVAGARPLILTELGSPSGVHGVDHQSTLLADQLRIVDEVGCAGATVFAFTDEWGVAGHPVEGWDFGVVTAERLPKPAAAAVSAWAARPLVELRERWPRVSVVVCAYNEQRTIGECLHALSRCDYPDLEVIVCDDGSTDDTLAIARTFPFTVLELEHGGLSRARNAGIHHSSGEIVAFCDADAFCHPQWPWFIALAFDDPSVMAAGGPNLPVRGAPLVERAVALSPGSPAEVLVSDDRAEHVPGCNMAFRREALLDLGCFDPLYTSAGDDVDVCWKILDDGGLIAFAPAAQVNHHRRSTVRGYLRQQRGYGRAETMLAAAHPHRFNGLGQARWSGVIYGGIGLLPKLLRPVVYHGYQGHAPFQPVARHRATEAAAWASALVPLILPVAVALAIGGLIWPGLWVAAALLVALLPAYAAAVAISLPIERDPAPMGLRLLVAGLHVLQPFARAWGRLRAPRRARHQVVSRPWWGDRATWLGDLDKALRSQGLTVRGGGPTDPWDLEVRRGPFMRTLVTTAVAWRWEPHARVQTRPRLALWALVAAAAVAALISDWWLSALLVTCCGAAILRGISAIHRPVRRAVAVAAASAASET